jgi:hypothetical protein
MTAPTVVYQNKIPHRNNQLASGRKNGKETKPTSPKRKPMPLPIEIRVMSDGLLNIENPHFAAIRTALFRCHFMNSSQPLT